MKKYFSILLVLFVVLSTGIIMNAAETEKKVMDIELYQQPITFNSIGQTIRPVIKVIYFDDTIEHEVFPESVTSDNVSVIRSTPAGLISTGEGTANIKFNYKGAFVSCIGKVTLPKTESILQTIEPSVSSISFDKLNDSKLISINAKYSDGTTKSNLKADKITSTNNNVVKVIDNEKFTSASDGSCSLTIYYNNKTTTVNITVKNTQQPEKKVMDIELY